MDNPFDKAVAAALRGKQAEKDIPLYTVVESTDIPERTLIRYLKGQRPIPLSKLIAITDALGEDPGVIIKSAVESVQVAQEQSRV